MFSITQHGCSEGCHCIYNIECFLHSTSFQIYYNKIPNLLSMSLAGAASYSVY